MVDFRKKLGKAQSSKIDEPIALYQTLDRAHDKGPLRPAQESVLTDWHHGFRDKRDVILKLHTGQGKTLIGLLILQCKINEGIGPALYLCPNNYLIDQTCAQAAQFGLRVCRADDDLPDEFSDGSTILVASVQKLFNGKTKFGLGPHSIATGTVLMDDCHACIDAVRDSFSVKLKREEKPYEKLLDLFSPALAEQGEGTLADIRNHDFDAFLAVPYWEWRAKHSEVVAILAAHAESKSIKFAWPLVKDIISDCLCVISGESLEIAPYLPPLDLFGTFEKAKHRVFMSATVADDSFLVKGLRLSRGTIEDPLVYKKEKWSGEKMVLIPSLIDETLDRSTIVSRYGKTNPRRQYGIAAISPGFNKVKDWEAAGASIAKKDTIYSEIAKLHAGDCAQTVVIVNRYDGIDLPDNSCRILIFDSKPFSESLVDRQSESCRASSEVTAIRTARAIEQGLGRSVRGEKDYCVFILIGSELVRAVRARDRRKHLSGQTRTQVEIGLEIAEFTKDEIEQGTPPLEALTGLIDQCLKRDEGWKEFYINKMNDAHEIASVASGNAITIFQAELDAEIAYQHGDSLKAVSTIQNLIDKHIKDELEQGWYLQEMARYKFAASRVDSNQLQISAHKKNRFLLRPQSGMNITHLLVHQKRIAKIIDWVQGFDSFGDLRLAVEDILTRLSFGVKAEKFESALHELGEALGFACERPDKEWKAGPDNLWALKEGEYLLIECKSEVHRDRIEIYKEESGQMNNAIGWFKNNYSGATSKNILIIPTQKLSKGGAFNDEVRIMRAKELETLRYNVRAFFAEFQSFDFDTLVEERIQSFVESHNLGTDSIPEYSRPAQVH